MAPDPRNFMGGIKYNWEENHLSADFLEKKVDHIRVNMHCQDFFIIRNYITKKSEKSKINLSR